MTLPLSDLETRRRILFADGAVTIRNLAGESVLITLEPGVSKSQLKKISNFLSDHFHAHRMNAIIVEIPKRNFLTAYQYFTLAKLQVTAFKGLAFLVNDFLTQLIMEILTIRNRFKCNVRTFKTFSKALAWSRTLK
ncbi:MAG TPA: hypothetical protein VGD65_18025 [Chryseosolibacter sp.]